MRAKEKEDIRKRISAINTARIASFSAGGLPVKNMDEEKGFAVGQIRVLHREMKEAIKKEDYEGAALIRNTIQVWAKKLGEN
ncbi:hypothetical protein HY02_05530 [Peptococcaceae bacterium SCADC1_2_3]|jgi:protein-arginine kinase activator protein McsA|nr:hypothetical protein DK28_0202720 [Peptococcaceae bacterium SCADC1_2_3]KFI35371.1 hypothetical protein HY00_05495 [Peptococcaceae bacterium SCADC1_2_3]KFI38227.1 hypothetical protein HY02_05530 [Peptococcaceae bacterium SCADC1_2_3]HBQ29133.1 hypothetical protein [Desulfotomaculum sp.]HCJ79220.1 hypothetical protein [Desulfotomaculum sp.]